MSSLSHRPELSSAQRLASEGLVMRPYGPLRGRGESLSAVLGVARRTRVHGASGVVPISGDDAMTMRCGYLWAVSEEEVG